jgi:hypothetical protein
MDYPLLEIMIEVVDYSPFVNITIDVFLYIFYIKIIIIIVSMEEVYVVLIFVQEGNQSHHESIIHLQNTQTSTSLGCVLITPPP